jgi:nicotinate-nucleotide adenylyltransferase
MKVAILGGSFDPIHKGHIEIIKKALENLDIDKIIVLPNYQNPLKISVKADDKVRLKWIKEAIKDIKNAEVSEYELNQQKSCYTIDTVKHFLTKFDKIIFLIGADNLETLSKWHKIDELQKLVEFVVFSRNGKKSDIYKTINLDIDISSTEIRKNLNGKYLVASLKDEIIGYYKLNK